VRRAIFERFAGFYDARVGGLARWREHCGSLAERLPPGARLVLDLGTGPGVSAFEVARRAPGVHVLGLDFARRMLARAARHRASEAARATSFAQADALRLPLRDAAVDAVTCHSFLYLVPQRAAALAEIRRVLRPGGRALFLEPRHGAPLTPGPRAWLREPHFAWIMTQWHLFGRWEGRFSRASLTGMLAAAGLRPLACDERLDGWGWLAVAERAE
jgi:ubiquinone/menaquinone biosynthesis C-methylase UbiE